MFEVFALSATLVLSQIKDKDRLILGTFIILFYSHFTTLWLQNIILFQTKHGGKPSVSHKQT